MLAVGDWEAYEGGVAMVGDMAELLCREERRGKWEDGALKGRFDIA